MHAVFGRINKKRQWHELPFPISLLNLLSLRLDLRDMNLFDTSEEIKTEATEEPPRLHDPSARTVSLELMTRDEFIPATTLNILAAAWIQFENHNWFFHGRGNAEETMDVPIEDSDDWPDHPMHVRRTVSVPASRDGAAGPGGTGPLDQADHARAAAAAPHTRLPLSAGRARRRGQPKRRRIATP